MAKSGSFNTSAYSASDGSRYLTFSWSITSQDVATNTTSISWTLKGGGTSKQWIYAGNFKVVIAGQTVYSYTGERIKLLNDTSVASGTFTFTHNADGTKNFSASAEGGIYTYAVNCSGSKTFDLDTIARASQPSCITFPEHTQNVGYFGDTISIHMNSNAPGVFKHTVRYAFGDLSDTCIDAETGKAATAVNTGFKWKIPESFMNLLPKTTSGSGTIYVDTYNGSTLIGTKYCGFTATINPDIIPSCTIQVLDDTDIQKTYGSLVRGLSKLYVKTNFYAAYSSPVKAYNITANGVKYTAAEITTGVLSEAGTTTITATVTDKRERTSEAVSASFPVMDYSPPKITALAVHRCNSDGSANDRGEFVEVVFSAAVTSLDAMNSASYSVRYKKTSVESWTTLTEDVNGKLPSDLADNYYADNESYIFAADGSSSYDVEVSVTDNHGTDTRSTSASTAFTLISFHHSGNALRFGGVAEEENTLQNDLTLIQRGNRYVFSTPGVAGSAGYILMARLTHKKANADTPITFIFTRRLEESPMTVHVQFNSDSTTVDPDLKGITYEGSNYGAFLVRTAESVWDLYVQKVSAYDTITLQDWYSSATNTDRMAVEFPGSLAASLPSGLDDEGWYRATPAVLQSIIDCLLPIGTIIQRYDHADPNTMYPGTTWVRIENTFLWGCDANGGIGTTGGEKTHTLTKDEMPNHGHGAVYTNDRAIASGEVAEKKYAWYTTAGSSLGFGSVYTGGDKAHNNMPPYTQVSIWRRTA